MSSLAAGILLGLLLLWLLLRQEKPKRVTKAAPAVHTAGPTHTVLLPDPNLLLVLLADREIHPGPGQIERFRKLMSRAEGMESTRLANVIASVFASSPDEEDRVRSAVEAWQASASPVADPGTREVGRAAPQFTLSASDPPARSWSGRAWVVGLGLVLGGLLLTVSVWWDSSPELGGTSTGELEAARPEDQVTAVQPGPSSIPQPTPKDPQVQSRRVVLPTFMRTAAAPGYLARGLLLAGGILLVASVALLVMAIIPLVRRKEERKAQKAVREEAKLVDQGRFWLRRVPPGPLVDPREGPRLALAMPLIDGDEVSRLLDLKRSIRDTLRVGIPTLSFRPRRVVPELWLAEDRQVESYLSSRAVGELERVLAEQGVPVRRFLMRGRTVGGMTLQRWVASAGRARLLLVSDGAALVGDTRCLTALASAEAGIWRVGQPQAGLESWVARGLRLVDRDGLRGFLSGQRGQHQRPLWPGAMQAWAAACALSPLPVLPEDALGLRAALELPVPVEALDLLMSRSIRRDLLQFSAEEQRELWAWTADVAPELRRRALEWWERRLRAEPGTGSEAHRDGLLATLKLWESPEEGLDQLVKLRQHPLFPELRGQLESLLVGGPQGLEEKGKNKLEELGLRAPEVVAEEPPPPGWGNFWAPLVSGALALLCVGWGTWSIFQEDSRPVVLSGGDLELRPGQREVELGREPVEGLVGSWPWRAEAEGGLVGVQVWAAGRWQAAEQLRAGDRLELTVDAGKIMGKSIEVRCDSGEVHSCGSCGGGGAGADPGTIAVLAGDPANPELQAFGGRLVDRGLVDAWVAAVNMDELPELPQFATVLGVGIAVEQVEALRGERRSRGESSAHCVVAPVRNATAQAGDAIDWRRSGEMLEQGEGKNLQAVYASTGPSCPRWIIKQATCTAGYSRVDMPEEPKPDVGDMKELQAPAGVPPVATRPTGGDRSTGSTPPRVPTSPPTPRQTPEPQQEPQQQLELQPSGQEEAPLSLKATIRIDAPEAKSRAASLSCAGETQSLYLGPSMVVEVPVGSSCFLKLDGAGPGDGETVQAGGRYRCSTPGGRLRCDVDGPEQASNGFVPIGNSNPSLNAATLRLSMDYNRYSGLLTCGDQRREIQLIGGVEERIEGDALESCVLALQGLSGLATLQFGKTYLCSGAGGLLRCE